MSDFDWFQNDLPSTEAISKKKEENSNGFRVERNRADKLAPVDGTSRVIGLSDWCLNTSAIRIGKSYQRGDLEALGFGKLSTITEVFFDEIIDLIKKARKQKDDLNTPDWDDIVTYIREVDGFGVTRACLLYFTATGKPIPPNILAGLLILENVIKEGLGGDESYQTTGNTLIDRSVLEWYFDSLQLDTTLMQSLKFIKHELGVIRGEDGLPRYFTSDTILFAEKTILEMVNDPSMVPLGLCDESELGWYTEGQKNAIRGVLESRERVVVITGAGGTGKTTTVKQIIRSVGRENKVAIFAPTGAASKRISDETTDIHPRLICAPSTIHYYIHNKRIRENAPCPNLIVIDEASMVDSETMGKLLNVIKEMRNDALTNLRFILVGDFSQLPPVGAGAIFNDIIRKNKCPVFRLTEVKRTSDPDLLLTFNQIREGLAVGQQAMKFCVDTKPKGLAKTVTDLIDFMFSKEPHWYRHTTIIAHRNATVDFVNAYIYNTLIETGEVRGDKVDLGDPLKKGATKTPDWKFAGAKVVFTKNDRKLEVVNGSIGYIKRFGQNTEGDPVVYISVVGGEDELEVKRNYSSIRLAYATSVHKCLPIDTMVRTDNGIVRLNELNVGDIVYSGNGETVVKWVSPIQKKVGIEFMTRSGRTYTTSEDHITPVMKPNGYVVDVSGELIEIGDRLLLSSEHCDGSVPTDIPRLYWKTINGSAKPINDTITHNMMWLFGVIIGDGCMTDKKDGIISICKPSSPELLQNVRDVCYEIGLTPHEHRKDHKEKSVYVCSIEFRAFMRGLGFDFTKAHQKKIPISIWSMPDSYKLEFVAGLIDSDGSSTKKRRSIRYVTASSELAYGIQNLLMEFGVQSAVRSYSPRSFMVSISGTNYTRIHSLVKLRNTNRICISGIERDSSDAIIIPYDILFKKYELIANLSGRSGKVCRRIYSIMVRNIDNSCKISRNFYNEINRIIGCQLDDFVYDEVVSIKRTEFVDMMDIEVDNTNHRFVLANGIVTHNCQGSEMKNVVYIHTNSIESRELVYTAVTRAKDSLTVLVPDGKIFIRFEEPIRDTIIGSYDRAEDI